MRKCARPFTLAKLPPQAHQLAFQRSNLSITFPHDGQKPRDLAAIVLNKASITQLSEVGRPRDDFYGSNSKL